MSLTASPLTLRIADWIARRRGPEAGEVALDRRRVYILPTRAGALFGAVVLVLLIGSINYDLQLGFLLTFLVASVALVGMHHTHANLAGVVLRGAQVEPVYAGDVAAFQIVATNPASADRYALRFAFLARRPGGAAAYVTTELPARGLRAVFVPLPAPRRGRLPAPRLKVETRFPFGLWRAWAYLTPALAAVVYPAPEADAPPLPASAGGGGQASGIASNGIEFAGVRPYQPGDAPKRIAWRLAARSDDLSVKQFEAEGGAELVLDYAALPATLDPERRLSRLTRWVLDADAAHLQYGLRLPGAIVPVDHGAAHRDRCLAALALCEV